MSDNSRDTSLIAKKVNLPTNYEVVMEGLPLDDFKIMCEYYI